MTRPAPAKRGRKTKLPTAVAVGSFAFKERVPQGVFESLLKHYLKAMGYPKAGVFLLLCGDKESRRLNASFRREDRATDILSFPEHEGGKLPRGFAGNLGDLALNLPYAWRKRGRFATAFEGELAYLVLHGLLHLAGIHHDTPSQEKAMEALMRRHFPPPAGLLSGLKEIKIKPSWSR